MACSRHNRFRPARLLPPEQPQLWPRALCPSRAMHCPRYQSLVQIAPAYLHLQIRVSYTPLKPCSEQAQQPQPSQSTAAPLGTHTPLRNSLSWKDRHKKGLLGLDRAASSSLADRTAPPGEALHAVRKLLMLEGPAASPCTRMNISLKNALCCAGPEAYAEQHWQLQRMFTPGRRGTVLASAHSRIQAWMG